VLWKKSQPEVTVFCNSEVLSFYCRWVCSTDIAVGCVGLIFQISVTQLLNWDRQLAEDLGVVYHRL
jgi:hypothetical protein